MESKSWQELIQITQEEPFVVDRVRIKKSGIVIEGLFELPSLARLSSDDQAFVTAFVRCHGSIKQMEKYFGVSYPTIKNRLNAIGECLEFVHIAPRTTRSEILDQLEQGTITADEAVTLLRGCLKSDEMCRSDRKGRGGRRIPNGVSP